MTCWSCIRSPVTNAASSLILNSPHERPAFHWRDDRGTLVLEHDRRSAGYEIFDTRNNTRRTEPLEQVTGSASGWMSGVRLSGLV
jgi:hypothetical protein